MQDSEKIAITLPVQAWNVVMNALSQRPFAEVAELIANIRAQAQPQIKTAPVSEPQQGETNG